MREGLSSLEAMVVRNTNHQIGERGLRAVERPTVPPLSFQISFKNTRATTVKGATIPSGSKTAATVLNTVHCVLGRFSFNLTPQLTFEVSAL